MPEKKWKNSARVQPNSSNRPTGVARNHCTASNASSETAAATSHQVSSNAPIPRPTPVMRCPIDIAMLIGQRYTWRCGDSGRRISLPSVLRATISASRTSLNGSLHPAGWPASHKPLRLLTLAGGKGQRGVAACRWPDGAAGQTGDAAVLQPGFRGPDAAALAGETARATMDEWLPGVPGTL